MESGVTTSGKCHISAGACTRKELAARFPLMKDAGVSNNVKYVLMERAVVHCSFQTLLLELTATKNQLSGSCCPFPHVLYLFHVDLSWIANSKSSVAVLIFGSNAISDNKPQ